ncbi:hypothetical protein BH23CYA1_BH23CYA1_18570 [soil metagenome]
MVASALAAQSTVQSTAPYRFLVIGRGSELWGDAAAGLQVARAVADWQLASVEALTVPHFTSNLVEAIAQSDYILFVEACDDKSCARTVQLEPIVGEPQPAGTVLSMAYRCDPWVLLSLTRQRYGYAPQAWLLQIPTERCELGEALSSTAQRGCDRALRTIEQFFRTYQQRPYMSQSACLQSVR